MAGVCTASECLLRFRYPSAASAVIIEPMSITSWSYAFFLIVILVLYYSVFAGRRQWICLLLASLAFYAFSGPKNLIFLCVTALTCWWGGLRLAKRKEAYEALRKRLREEKRSAAVRQNAQLPDPQTKETPEEKHQGTAGSEGRELQKAAKAALQKDQRKVLAAVLLINFGLLALVKYWGVAARGWLLPLGMSFYTFQSVSYLLDVYNGKIPAEKNFLHYLLFVSFFPQLLQGPIGRFDQLAPQLLGEHSFSFERWKRGMLLIAFGLMKKYAIANMLSPAIAALLDENIRGIPGAAVVTGILMYSFQQYADFSGGIDMVSGAAELFGISLAPNFRQPYLALSLGDFWRRWHISLGAWMRDYVFYPFALLRPVQRFGKRVSKRFGKHLGVVLPASIANLLVFFLVGIWHGPELHYVLWGLYNGLVIALSDVFSPQLERLGEMLHFPAHPAGARRFRIVRTFVIVNIGWFFDRIYRWEDCMHAFHAAFTPGLFRAGEWAATMQTLLVQTGILSRPRLLLVFAGIAALTAVDLLHERGRTVYDSLAVRPRAVRWCAFYVMIVFIQLAMDFSNASSAFMYANF